MKNCKQCGHNDFSFKSRGDFTVVTCRHCNNEFEFVRKKKPVAKTNHCSKCNCQMERAKVTLTPATLLAAFYYTYYFKCPKCGETTNDPTTKRHNALYTKSYEKN